MSSRWTNELLDGLRQIGDPETDSPKRYKCDRVNEEGWPAPLFRAPRREAKDRNPETWLDEELTKAGMFSEEKYWLQAVGWKDRLDRARVAEAQDLFVRFGQEVGVSLLAAALPEAYAAESGARVLASSEALLRSGQTDPQALSRRIGRTAQFLLDVMLEDQEPINDDLRRTMAMPSYPRDPRLSLLPGGRGYNAARATRRVHSHVRHQMQKAPTSWKPLEELPSGLSLGVPINQVHLIGTYLSFSVTVWYSLERLGIRWTSREKEAYLHLWDWVAQLMGVGTPAVRREVLRKWKGSEAGKQQFKRDFGKGPIRPQTVTEAEELLVLIRDRNWPATEEVNAFQNSSGKQLLRALLDDLEDAMPGGMQSLPLEVVRYLVDPRVSVALGLGGGGLPPVLLNWVQGRSRGWNSAKANPLIAPTMRWAGNQVSLHSFVSFMKKEGGDRLEFRDLDDGFMDQRRRSRRTTRKEEWNQCMGGIGGT